MRREQAQIRKWFPMYTDPAGKAGVALTYHELDEHLTAAAGHALTEMEVKAHWEQAELYSGQDHEREERPVPEDSIDGDKVEEGDLFEPAES